jgi:hypothetical protein
MASALARLRPPIRMDLPVDRRSSCETAFAVLPLPMTPKVAERFMDICVFQGQFSPATATLSAMANDKSPNRSLSDIGATWSRNGPIGHLALCLRLNAGKTGLSVTCPDEISADLPIRRVREGSPCAPQDGFLFHLSQRTAWFFAARPSPGCMAEATGPSFSIPSIQVTELRPQRGKIVVQRII